MHICRQSSQAQAGKQPCRQGWKQKKFPALIGKSCSCCYRGFYELHPEYMFCHTFPFGSVVLAWCIIFFSGKIQSVMSKFKLGHIPTNITFVSINKMGSLASHKFSQLYHVASC